MSARSEALARRIEEGARNLASFAEGLTDSEWNTVVPHTGQKRKMKRAPWSPVRTYSVAVPNTWNGARKLANAAKGLPVRR